MGISAVSAFLTWAAIAFLQVPFQTWCNEALLSLWGESTVLRWLLLAGIPEVVLSDAAAVTGNTPDDIAP